MKRFLGETRLIDLANQTVRLQSANERNDIRECAAEVCCDLCERSSAADAKQRIEFVRRETDLIAIAGRIDDREHLIRSILRPSFSFFDQNRGIEIERARAIGQDHFILQRELSAAPREEIEQHLLGAESVARFRPIHFPVSKKDADALSFFFDNQRAAVRVRDEKRKQLRRGKVLETPLKDDSH